jgi:pSer/pThr/pTyr-binding forkhead associated (FHA) protein
MHANLVLFKNDGSQKVFPLQSNITVIGRRHDCDLCVPLSQISRRQCRLSKDENLIKIHDLDSRNGTYVNGTRVQESAIKAGDYIKIGPLVFVLQIDGQPEKISPPPKQAGKKIGTVKAPLTAMPEEKTNTETQVEKQNDSSGSHAELDLSDSFAAELDKL